MSAEAAREIIERERNLIRRVFSTEDGQELLRLLADQYVFSTIASKDTNQTYLRLGAQELVVNFINIAGDNHE